MPFSTINDLPANLRAILPEHAQEIYKEAFNSAYDEYADPHDRRDNADREETAHKVAWSAVKGKYEKGADNKWHLSERG